MTKTEAVKKFLQLHGTSPYATRYSAEMELQVNVAQDDGDRIKGEFKGKRWMGWTNPETGEIWKVFRVPWNANAEPNYQDTKMKFSLEAHAESIGMTGWNWKQRKSVWVGFDFDSIVNHAAGLSEEELEKIKGIVKNIPWVSLITSTSGKGFHLYVDLEDPVATNNHTEHAALARSILSVMSIEAGYNFSNAVDVCGAVLWVWHRNQSSNGFRLIKEGEKLPSSKIPANWIDHVAVTNGSKVKITGNRSDSQSFEELFSSTKIVELDEEHKRLLKWFSTSAKMDFWWDNDHNMLVCHTFDLAAAHKELSLKGVFYTDSSGSSAQNSFAFPLQEGAWVVRRHSKGVNEHPSWTVDTTGWTRCVFNDDPEFVVAARSNSGIQNTSGAYVFHSASNGAEALRQMGINVSLPKELQHRNMTVKEQSSGDLIVQVVREDSDTRADGWLLSKNGKHWECIINRVKKKRDFHIPDNLIRHTIAEDAEAGWWIKTRGKWVSQNRSNVVSVVLAQDTISNRNDVDSIISKAILNPWEIVNLPFAPEYPGNRQWNKMSAQLSCKPKEGSFETWKLVLEHCGCGLDDSVYRDEWCAKNAINSGSEYLACWVASIFQRPNRPLPYLFFVGPQNSGKSTLHEAVHLLMSRGYSRADHALMNQQGFNGEIASAVLCVVEETNLNQNKQAANRIKDWVTGHTISVQFKHKTTYDIKNTTHWIQCANDFINCPVFPGDTRIVVCYVDKPEHEISKETLFERLEDEKAAFLDYVMSLDLPEPEGRLGLPCLSTEEKKQMEHSTMDSVQQYFEERIIVIEGECVAFEDLFEDFLVWLPAAERQDWTKVKFSMKFPQKKPIVKGRAGNLNTTTFGNISLTPVEKPNGFIWKKSGGRLRKELKNG